MDNTELDYALMAGEAYFYKRDPVNQIPVPAGATSLGGGLDGRQLASGYEARAYHYNGEIVISFAGTYFPNNFLSGALTGDINDADRAGLLDWGANLNLGTGLLSQQLKDAAQFYQDVKRAHPEGTISFTGHSLGGGLAALMGVMFDKQAITFDPAPFRSAATESNAQALQTYLSELGYAPDADLASFTATQGPLGEVFPEVAVGLLAVALLGGPLTQAAALALIASPMPTTIRGEDNVQLIAVAGEFLTGNDFSDFRNRLRIGTGGSELITHGSLGKLAGGDAHSISLLYLLGKSAAFQALTQKLPELLPTIFDRSIYAFSVDTGRTNFAEHLLRQELANSGTSSSSSGSGFLDKFVADLNRIASDQGVTATESLREALTVLAMDYYYFSSATTATQFYTLESGAIHFSLDDIDAMSLKGLGLLRDAASSTAIGSDPFETSGLREASHWHVQTGGGSMIWQANALANDAAIGGNAADVLRSGGGDDVLVGGGGDDVLDGGGNSDVLLGDAGNDTLVGGSGNDILFGGQGTDTYQFTGSFDKDTVIDSDGQGRIQIDGHTLGLARGTGKANEWVAELGTGSGSFVTLALRDSGSSSTGKELVISRLGNTDDTITIKHFSVSTAQSAGYLGIQLDPTQRVALVQGTGVSAGVSTTFNTWSDTRFEAAALNGLSSSMAEGQGKSFTVSFSRPALAGETLTLALQGALADRVKVNTDGNEVNANGAVISLAEGQTFVTFLLKANADLNADLAGALSVSYHGAAETTQSNSWSLQITDASEAGTTYTMVGGERVSAGEYEAWNQETQTHELLSFPAGDGDYLGFHDYAGNGELFESLGDPTSIVYTNLKLHGLAGNDVLFGMANADELDGGSGDDVIFGDFGSDKIIGGDGNDVILSNVAARPFNYRWTPEELARYGQPTLVSTGISTTALTEVAPGLYEGGILNWEIRRNESGMLLMPDFQIFRVDDLQSPDEGDTVDAGAGDDHVWGGLGADFVQGGDGQDQLNGMGGSDVIFGGEGDDEIRGDDDRRPPAMTLYQGMQSGGLGYTLSVHPQMYPVPPQVHGNDYLDGGSGDDKIWGDGGDDILLGADGNDELRGDSTSLGLGAEHLGRDYLDGGSGDDWIVGGGNDDVLYGGTGNDHLWGDANSGPDEYGDRHGRDVLDGGAGNDYLEAGGGHDELWGGDGNDVLWGDSWELELSVEFHGDDFLNGGAGDDVLRGGGGDDQLLGGDDNDELLGDLSSPGLSSEFFGRDYLDGGAGDDRVVGGGGDDVLHGGIGNDELWGDDDSFDLVGTRHGRDFLDGGDGDDHLLAGGDDDELWGGSGNDRLWGDDDYMGLPGAQHGRDYLNGGDGDDYLEAGGGNDELVGGDGNDYLWGDSDSVDLSLEFQGDDFLNGGEGDDYLEAGGGNDVLMGGDGDDELLGDSGDDLLNGGDGTDHLFGGAGDDTYVFDSTLQASVARIVDFDGVNRILVAGSLSDVAFASSDGVPGARTGSLFMLIGNRTIHIDGGLSGAVHEIVTQSGERATLHELVGRGVPTSVALGTTNATAVKTIWGGTANDTLTAGVDNSYLWGGQGDDDLVLSSNDNIIHFERGDGQDSLQAQASSGNVIELGRGISMENLQLEVVDGGEVWLSLGEGDALKVPLARNLLTQSGLISSVRLSDGQEVMWWELVDKGVRIQGDETDNVLDGTDANDVITANAGDDALVGNAGDDTLEGGAGTDFMIGGEGDDSYRVQLGDGYSFILDDHGRNTLMFGAGLSAASLTATQPAGTEDVVLAFSSGETVHISGGMQRAIDLITFADGSVLTFPELLDKVNANSMVLSGDDASNELVSASGADVLMGNGGNDRLWGNGGSDELIGGRDHDLLVGGRQNDVLQGGEGDDAYRFALGDGQDRIEDVEGAMTLEFGAGIAATDLRATRETIDGNAWLRMAYSTNDFVLIQEGDALETLSVKLADGAVLNKPEMYALALQESRTVIGTEANDTLYGYAGDDTLNGGGGTDVLHGGRGQDVYVMSALGLDTVQDRDGGRNVIQTLAESSSELALQRLGADLLIDDSANQSKLLIEGFFDNQQTWSIQLAGGGFSDLRALAIAQLASDNSLEERRDAFYQRILGIGGPYVQDSFATADGNEYIYTRTTIRNVVESNNPLIEANSSRTETDFSEIIGSFLNSYTYTYYETETTIVPGQQRLFAYIAGEHFYSPAGTWMGNNIVIPAGAVEIEDENGRVNVYVIEPDQVITTQIPRFVSGQYTENIWRYITDMQMVVHDVRGGDEGNQLLLPSEAYTRSPLPTMVSGGAGDDVIIRTEYRQETYLFWPSPIGDFLDGGAGDDQIFAGVFGDEISGGTGFDYLSGAEGDDVYFVSASEDGFDTIYDISGAQYDLLLRIDEYDEHRAVLADALENGIDRNDVVRFGAGINRQDLEVELSSIEVRPYPEEHTIDENWGKYPEYQGSIAALQITWGVAGGIRVAMHEELASAIGFGIERYEFADGTSMTHAEMLALVGSTPDGVEGDERLIGTADNDVLTGGTGNDTLNGKAGADTMAGGTGEDRYFVDNAGDVVVEHVNEGAADIVYSTISYELGAHVERIHLRGADAVNAAGNELDNILYGHSNAAANVLSGGLGDDTYHVGAGDTVVEGADAGTDRVITGVDHTLASHVENLSGNVDTGLQLSGNELNNTITGHDGNDILDGGAGDDTLNGRQGTDTMAGGVGEDRYFVDDVGDVVIELAGEGVADIVYSAVSYNVGANVERIHLQGAEAITAEGNDLDNILYGHANSAANVLSGGLGNDTYHVGAGDTIVEAVDAGIDRVITEVDHTLGSNVENLSGNTEIGLRLSGNELDNTITGHNGNDSLEGGAGNDTMNGRQGDDTMAGGEGEDRYFVDDVGDVVIELAGEGVADIVYSTVSYNLGANVERIHLQGAEAITAGGNDLDNILYGHANSAANVLSGGLGNDTYHVGASDTVVEAVNAGTDRVITGVDHALSNHVENLTGNADTGLRLRGNELNNVITGDIGDDTLDGGMGKDTLVGGAGNDTYVLGLVYGADVIKENDATSGNTDLLRFLEGVATDQIWFRQVSSNLEVSIIGTSDKAIITNWYAGNQYKVEQFQTADNQTLLSSQVDALVSAMAAFSPPPPGQTTLTPEQQSALSPVIAANWN